MPTPSLKYSSAGLPRRVARDTEVPVGPLEGEVRRRPRGQSRRRPAGGDEAGDDDDEPHRRGRPSSLSPAAGPPTQLGASLPSGRRGTAVRLPRLRWGRCRAHEHAPFRTVASVRAARRRRDAGQGEQAGTEQRARAPVPAHPRTRRTGDSDPGRSPAAGPGPTTSARRRLHRTIVPIPAKTTATATLTLLVAHRQGPSATCSGRAWKSRRPAQIESVPGRAITKQWEGHPEHIGHPEQATARPVSTTGPRGS